MANRLVEVADAVKNLINTGTFTPVVTAVRLFVPDFTLETLAALKVTVVPRGMDTTIQTREQARDDALIDVAIQDRVADNLAAVNPLMDLVDEIDLFLRNRIRRKLIAPANAGWIATTRTAYDVDHMEQLRVFTSVLSLTYRLYR